MNSRRTCWDLVPNRFSSALTRAYARVASLLDRTLTSPPDRSLKVMDATGGATDALTAIESKCSLLRPAVARLAERLGGRSSAVLLLAAGRMV